MGQDPDAIRQEIEGTRSQMGETIEAIGYKTDVKARAKDSVSARTDAVKDRVNSAMGRASDSTPSTGDVKQGARQAVSTAQENPLGLAIGAAAVGFVAGMLIPSTSVEDEKIGPMADQLKERARETGQEALEHGKQVAQDVAESAQETVRESGQQHAQELASSASPQS
jgi:gas vesicle protein